MVNMRLKPSFAQPTVVIVQARGEITEQSLRSELSRYLDGSVRVLDDVQFQPLS